MEINTLLEQFINTECSCGKSHKIKLPKIVVCSGAIKELPILMQQKGLKKAQIRRFPKHNLKGIIEI